MSHALVGRVARILVPLGSGWLTPLNLNMAASLQWLSAYLPRDTFLLGFFVGPKKQIDDLLGHQIQWQSNYGVCRTCL